MTNHRPDLKKFLVRLGVTVAAVVLVMYLAKVWFVDQRRADLPSQMPTSGQVDTSFPESRQPAGTQVISWQDAAKHYGEYATVQLSPHIIQERRASLTSTRITSVTLRRLSLRQPFPASQRIQKITTMERKFVCPVISKNTRENRRSF